VKTTLEIPDELLLQTEASAASRGESLTDFVTEALRAHLRGAPSDPEAQGWRRVFGKADASQVAEVDRIIAEELEQIDPDSWR